MKTRTYLLIGLGVIIIASVFAFKPVQKSPKVQYMQVTTIESIIPGGLGRSKMLITKPDGTFTEEKMENLYSMAGINFGNVTANDKDIVNKINILTADNWELESVTVGAQSPSDGTAQGIFLTRYLFKKSVE